MHITPIRAFKDNYLWLIADAHHAVVVDPGDAAPVQTVLDTGKLELAAILITHHHADHIGGLQRLLARKSVPVFGPAGEDIPGVSTPVSQSDSVSLPQLGIEFSVLDVPGHTRGHVAYYGAGMLFCGDTLFACGCGRLFEGTADQMWRSLSKLAALPDTTRAYCAHEYTQSNIRFARALDPDNQALAEREAQVAALRARDVPTVPFTLGEELATNPFLRCADPAIAEAASRYAGRKLTRPGEIFAAIRSWKDQF